MTTSRRRFISSAAGLAGITIIRRELLGGLGYTAPSDKLNIAGIGIGGVGKRFVEGCKKERILALCDVDQEFARPVFQTYPHARKYSDYREMLDKEKEIDAVIIATPDHTHAVIAARAMKKKKHVLCVKPLARTIYETRKLAEAARKAGVATNITASPSSVESACQLIEMIQDGAIGEIKEVHCWSNRPIWPQGLIRPEGKDKVPPHFNWDLWIGPAPMRPYRKEWPPGHLALWHAGKGKARKRGRGIYHPFNFRGWWDFGTGALGDMGVHHFNTMFKALKLGHPLSVEASSTRLMPESPPLSSMVTWQFPARKGLPPVKIVWYDGGLKPARPPELEEERELANSGNLYVGTKGKILGGSNSGRIIPEKRMRAYKMPPERLVRKLSIEDEWISACKGNDEASCNFDVGGLITEVVLLGNVAIRSRKKLYWNPKKLKVTNYDDANRFIREAYRSGWSI